MHQWQEQSNVMPHKEQVGKNSYDFQCETSRNAGLILLFAPCEKLDFRYIVASFQE